MQSIGRETDHDLNSPPSKVKHKNRKLFAQYGLAEKPDNQMRRIKVPTEWEG